LLRPGLSLVIPRRRPIVRRSVMHRVAVCVERFDIPGPDEAIGDDAGAFLRNDLGDAALFVFDDRVLAAIDAPRNVLVLDGAGFFPLVLDDVKREPQAGDMASGILTALTRSEQEPKLPLDAVERVRQAAHQAIASLTLSS